MKTIGLVSLLGMGAIGAWGVSTAMLAAVAARKGALYHLYILRDVGARPTPLLCTHLLFLVSAYNYKLMYTTGVFQCTPRTGQICKARGPGGCRSSH
jgi:hypothetical protein